MGSSSFATGVFGVSAGLSRIGLGGLPGGVCGRGGVEDGLPVAAGAVAVLRSLLGEWLGGLGLLVSTLDRPFGNSSGILGPLESPARIGGVTPPDHTWPRPERAK